MARLRDTPDDLFALCGAAADALGIPEPAFVEKDFWVVELLRSVSKPLALVPVDGKQPSAKAMFKGGTSLSKAFRLINRFSEDVDILVAVDGYGAVARDKRVLRPICDRVQKDLGVDDDHVSRLPYKAGVSRNVDYVYPRGFDSGIIRPGVRLEMGIRGGTLPGTVTAEIQSYIADYIVRERIDADFVELEPVSIEVIAPVRTLAEKLALLHHAGCRAKDGDASLLDTAGRHFYDLDMLVRDEGVRGALSTPESSVGVLSADVDEYSEKYNWPFSPRPQQGYADSPVFGSDRDVRQAAQAAYENGLALVWGERHAFSDVLATVEEFAHLL